MSTITTHILNTSLGKPAEGVQVELYQQNGNDWNQIAEGITNADGRVANWSSEINAAAGTYKIRFNTAPYFEKMGTDFFYPFVEIFFIIKNNEHYHVPLLLNPFGFATYRGS